MNQPLGNAVGNALEVKEAIETLHGGGPADFREHCLTVAGKMLELGGKAPNLAAATEHLAGLLDGGSAWQKFEEWITAQGGSPNQLADPALLPTAPLIEPLPTPRSGYLAAINAAEVGQTVVDLGGGRAKKGDPIDYGVGVILRAKVGDFVEADAPLLTVYANSRESLEAANDRLLAAITWSEEPVELPLHVLKIIG